MHQVQFSAAAKFVDDDEILNFPAVLGKRKINSFKWFGHSKATYYCQSLIIRNYARCLFNFLLLNLDRVPLIYQFI